jgi:diadenosine tetraphosphate (Ap4A) HIT family hydrolase
LQHFTLHPRLDAESLPVAELPLSAVRLMRDANYPWLLLIPRRAGLTEIVDLPPPERLQLMAEIGQASEALRSAVSCEKLNIAALGMVVRQLHVHVIARNPGDPAWPRPVWNAAPARPYEPGQAEALAASLAAGLRRPERGEAIG